MLILGILLLCVVGESTSDNGFNNNIAWSNDLTTALAESAAGDKRPVFVLIHKVAAFAMCFDAYGDSPGVARAKGSRVSLWKVSRLLR